LLFFFILTKFEPLYMDKPICRCGMEFDLISPQLNEI
jgi:hypothetical protein